MLIKVGATVDARDGDNETALHLASFFGHTDVVKVSLQQMPRLAVERSQVLIEAGAIVDAKTKYNWTPLHAASYNGRLIVAEVIQNASPPNSDAF